MKVARSSFGEWASKLIEGNRSIDRRMGDISHEDRREEEIEEEEEEIVIEPQQIDRA